MKTQIILLSLLISTISLTSHAYTRAQFLGLQAMVELLPTDSGGGADPDSHTLYEAIKAPTQGSPMGPGKSIVTADRVFNLMCGRSQKGDQCTLFLRNSSKVVMDPSSQKISYSATGPDADHIRSQFVLDSKSEFHFITTDGQLRIDLDPTQVSFRYSEAGL